MEDTSPPQSKLDGAFVYFFILVASGSEEAMSSWWAWRQPFSTPLKQKPQFFHGWLWGSREQTPFPLLSLQRCLSLGYRLHLEWVAAVNSRGAATQSQKWQMIFLPRPLTLGLLIASELLCDTWKSTLGFPSAIRKSAKANGHAHGVPTETQVQISMLMLKL